MGSIVTLSIVNLIVTVSIVPLNMTVSIMTLIVILSRKDSFVTRHSNLV
jgi:hypothetical protein